MVEDKEKKDKYRRDENLQLSKLWLTSFKDSISEKRKKRFLRRRFRNKLLNRKKREAFPRKNGKYNELFQDFGKESWSRDTTAWAK